MRSFLLLFAALGAVFAFLVLGAILFAPDVARLGIFVIAGAILAYVFLGLVWPRARVLGALLGLLAVAACTTPFKGDIVTLDSAAGGGNINPTTGVTLGYIQTSGHFVPAVSADGKTPITVQGPCGTVQALASYGILAGNASATLTSTSATTAATSPSGGATANGPAQSVAVAANRMSSTGEAAILLAAGGGGAPQASTVQARENCSQALPAAAANSVTH